MPTKDPKDSCMCDYLATHPWINEHSMCPENKFEEASTFQCVLFGMVVAVAIVAILSVIALVASVLL